MAKPIALLLASICLIFSVKADPIFLSSSKRINDISKNLFFDAESFNTLVNDKLLSKTALPANVFIFDVQLNDRKYTENQSLLLKELASHPAVQKRFAPSSNTFSSVYVKDALSPEFSKNLLNTVQNAGDYELVQSNLRTFRANHADLKSKKTVSVTSLLISELSSLETALNQIQGTDNVVILKFTDDSDKTIPQTLAKLQTNERLLQDEGNVVLNHDNDEGTDTTAAPTTPKTTTVGASAPPTISPAGLTGYVISVILMIGVYIGFQVMQGIKGPTKFYKDTLQIGKEQ